MKETITIKPANLEQLQAEYKAKALFQCVVHRFCLSGGVDPKEAALTFHELGDSEKLPLEATYHLVMTAVYEELQNRNPEKLLADCSTGFIKRGVIKLLREWEILDIALVSEQGPQDDFLPELGSLFRVGGEWCEAAGEFGAPSQFSRN
jgi:hypothetical protein